MAALWHQHCGRASQPSRQSSRKKLAALALGHWCPEPGVLRAPGSHLSPPAQGTCVCLFYSVPRQVPRPVEALITTALIIGQADSCLGSPPLEGVHLQPRDAVMGQGSGQPPGLIRLGVFAACLFSKLAHLPSPFSSSFGRPQDRARGRVQLLPRCSGGRA